MFKIIFEAIGRKFALDMIAGAAHAVTVGATALDHESGNYTMEYLVVVEALVDKGNEVINGVWCDFGIKLCLDNSAVFHFDSYDGVHSFPPDLSVVF
jgi:hypothetical protein